MLLWGKEETTSLRSLKKTPTSTSEAMLSTVRRAGRHHSTEPQKNTHLNERSNVEPSLEDRPLVEEREEFFALSREKEKTV